VEDSLKTKEQLDKVNMDNEALIQEQLRDAQLVDLPSELKANPVIHRGDEELPSPMTVRQLSSAGYVYVWDTRTYERAPVLYYMLPSVLKRRRQDGSFVWTTNDPKQKPKRGTLKCFLHPDSPDRKLYDTMGLRTCRKDNITNNYEVQQHMLKKHAKEWAAIETMIKEKERQEDRKLQQAILSSFTKKQEEMKFVCDVCGRDDFKSNIALQGHKRSHK